MDREINLLIHHHAIAFNDGEAIWIQSSIGAWVDGLSGYFGNVGLLLFISNTRTRVQDYRIRHKNVILISLGTANNRNHIKRNNRVKGICFKISPEYDVLLIRGFTPRQLQVYNGCRTKIKIFFLVNSLIDSKPELKYNYLSILTWLMHHLRILQLGIISRHSRLFTNSIKIMEEIEAIYDRPSTFVPTNTLTEHQFSFTGRRPLQNPIELLFCGRVIKQKGIEDLLAALAILLKDNIECRLSIAGIGTIEYIQFLNKITFRLSINEKVRFLGYISFGPELMSLYGKADIYVLPSWHEGFPRTIWEAAANCTPVIATTVGGIPSLVSDKEIYFVPVRNPAAIADSIKTIINNPSSAEEKVYNAFNLAKKYTAEKCSKMMADSIYRVFNG